MTTAVNYDTVTTAAGDVARHLDVSERTAHGPDCRTSRSSPATGTVKPSTAYIEIQSNLARDMDGLNADLEHVARLLTSPVSGYQDTDKGIAPVSDALTSVAAHAQGALPAPAGTPLRRTAARYRRGRTRRPARRVRRPATRPPCTAAPSPGPATSASPPRRPADARSRPAPRPRWCRARPATPHRGCRGRTALPSPAGVPSCALRQLDRRGPHPDVPNECCNRRRASRFASRSIRHPAQLDQRRAPLARDEVARPGGIGRGRTLPRRSPSPGSPDRTTPCAPSSLMRCMNGSYIEREAPAELRAMMKRTPTSRANGRFSTSTRQRIAAGGGDQLVVVDDDEERAGPVHQLRSRSCCGVTSGSGAPRCIKTVPSASMCISMRGRHRRVLQQMRARARASSSVRR